MVGSVRKRARESLDGARAKPAKPAKPASAPLKRYEKRRAQQEADEISSDSGSSAPDAAEDAGGVSDSSSSSDDAAETVDQKRIRLARAYLQNAGLDPDAAPRSGSERSGSESEGGRGISRLQDAARAAAGRATACVAAGVAAGADGGVLRVSRACRAHDVAATCVALDFEGRRAASGGKDSCVVAWDVETGVKVVSLRPRGYEEAWRAEPAAAPGHVGHVRCVAVADGEGGNVVASGGEDRVVRVWDVRAGRQVGAMKGHQGAVNALCFRRGSKQLFSGAADRAVNIWDVGDMAFVETLFGHGGEVCGVSSLKKERALSCGRDGTMRLYKILDGSHLVFKKARTTSLEAVAMVNEQRFVSGDDDGTFALWHVNKKRPVAAVAKAHGGGVGSATWVSAVAAGCNSDLAVSGAGDGVVRLWHCEDRPPALKLAASVDVGRGFVNGLALDGACKVLAAAVGQEPRLGRWERKKQVKAGLRFISLPQQ